METDRISVELLDSLQLMPLKVPKFILFVPQWFADEYPELIAGRNDIEVMKPIKIDELE